MDNSNLLLLEAEPATRFAARDVLAIGFRHRRLLVASFFAVLLGVTAFSLFTREYESKMQLLVKRERVDPVVSPEDNAAVRYQTNSGVSEEELNSEVQLLLSDDLLRKVVVTTGLHQRDAGRFWSLFRSSNEEKRIASAQRALAKAVVVDVPKKSNMIVLRYRSRNGAEAAQVLRTLSALYLEKHAEVHRPPGQYEFFDREAERFRQELASAEAQLAEFPQKEGVVSGGMERDLMVQKIADLNVTLEATKAAIAETKKRTAALQAQMGSTPERMTTLIRRADNPPLMEKLKGTLLDLELQRTELLQKYQPNHRKVQEVEQKIAETRAAIESSLNAPMTEQSTDRDPTYEWLRGELAKAQTDLDSLEARATATSRSIADFERRAMLVNQRSIEQQDLIRTAKQAEDSYQLYVHKREEARITGALDRSKILNVAIAQEPTTPVFPVDSLPVSLMIAVMAACVVSAGAVLTAEYLDPTFRTPEEVQRYLGAPVLAALPEHVN